MKKQKSILKTLITRSFAASKARNIVAVIAITLTTLMFTTLFVLAQSMSKNILEMTFRQTGYDAQASFKSITNEQAAKISAHPDVKELQNSIVLGLGENKALRGHQVEIRWADDSYATHVFSKPTSGALPTAEDEIALDTITLDRLGIPHKLGESVTLEWRPDLTKEEKTTSTFTLSGYWEGNQSVYASMAWVSRAFADEMTGGADAPGEGQLLGTHTAQVLLHSDKTIEKTMDTILSDSGLTELEYGANLAYSPELNMQAAQEALPMYLGMLLVFAAGYLIIYNIFQISTSADIQFYGKLKTLGTTKKQLKKLIYGQASLLCVIGIPIGLLLGSLLGMLLVPALMGSHAKDATVSASPFIYLGSALFAYLTVLISCLRPARLAGMVSPIEALRYDGCDASLKKKTKKGTNGASLSGMAWANLWRNKKRTVTVICSLSLALVLLNCFYAKNAAFDMEKYLAGLTIADFQLTDASSEDTINGYNPQGDTISKELLAQIASLKGLEKSGSLYSHDTLLEMDDQTAENLEQFYTKETLDEWASYDPQGVDAYQKALETKSATATIFGMDSIPLETLTQKEQVLSGTFDSEKFAQGGYVLAISSAGLSNKTELQELGLLPPAASPGSIVTLDNKDYTVMAVVNNSQDVITEGQNEKGMYTGFSLEYILPADTFKTLWPQNTVRKYFFNMQDSSVSSAQELLDTYSKNVDTSLDVTSRSTITEQYKDETRSSAVMGNTISIVIALVGILNFINSMATAALSRKKEFAMLQSVGMTKPQLLTMLTFEGFSYALITLAISLFASTLAVGIGVRALVADGYSTFHFTLMPLAVCTPTLLVLAVLIPYICFRNLERQSVVQRLRAID